MADVYRAKKRKEIEGREKPLWVDVGFTVIGYDKDGSRRLMLVDERTDQSYSLFPVEKKEQAQGGGSTGSSDDIPF